MIKRIALLEPKGERLNVFSRYELPRLGSVLLATIMRKLGYDARAYFLNRKEILAGVHNVDLVAISSITPTANVAYSLGDDYRKQGIPVVMGGPHVTFLPEEALNHSDFCIMGEGEIAFPRLVEALNRSKDLEKVPGLAWKGNGRLNRNILPRPVKNLDTLPFCDFSLLDLGHKKLGGPIGRPIIPIQTSRGCPFGCNFCSVTCMFGRRYRYRSTENILAELKSYDSRKHFLFFYDDNFTSNRKRVKHLLGEMIELNLGFDWVTQVRSDVARDGELLDLMKRAGCRSLFIGFETVDPESLREMEKSQSPEEIERAISEIRKRKIHIHGMFVFGFDADTPSKAKSTVDFAIKKKIDTTQFLILTPLPGTKFFDQLKRQKRLLDYHWDTYDGHHVKFRPARFSLWGLQKAQIVAHTRFFALGRLFLRLLRGRFRAFIYGIYALRTNRRWLRTEREYLRRIKSSLSSFKKVIKRKSGLSF